MGGSLTLVSEMPERKEVEDVINIVGKRPFKTKSFARLVRPGLDRRGRMGFDSEHQGRISSANSAKLRGFPGLRFGID